MLRRGNFRNHDAMIPAADDPFVLFAQWMAEAVGAELNDPNAMTVASVGADGRPAARILLLKDVDPADFGPDRGFVFYTNQQSRKGRELAENPNVALLFHWKSLRRQIRIEGKVQPVTTAEADAYFAIRPYGSQIGAWASQQSRPLDDRSTLEARVRHFEAQHPEGQVPRPPHWSGYRLVPTWFEYWQDMPFRLHDRRVYRRQADGWAQERLYP